MATKYVIRNGVRVPADKAKRMTEMSAKGYSYAFIAKTLDVTEHEVISILNVEGN